MPQAIRLVALAFLSAMSMSAWHDLYAQGTGQNCTNSPAAGDEVRILSAHPPEMGGVVLQILGVRGSSPISIFQVTPTVSGANITIDVQMNDIMGFAVGGTYCYRLQPLAVAPGTYSITYRVQSGTPTIGFQPPRVVATSSVTIQAGVVDAIPVLAPLGLVLMSIAVFVGAAFSRRLL